MSDKKIEIDAKYYGVPAHFLKSVKRGEWGAVRGYAQRRWNEDGYVLLKKYRNAVSRVLKVFILAKNYPDTYLEKITPEQEKKIAYYIHALGMKTIIDDVCNCCRVNPRVRTINYFLIADKGKKTGRWGMMYFDKMNADWEKRKEEELNCHVGNDLFLSPGKMVKGQWQIDAEKRLKELEGKGMLDSEEMSEAMTLGNRIARHGSNIPLDPPSKGESL